jgi:hypothetical protein
MAAPYNRSPQYPDCESEAMVVTRTIHYHGFSLARVQISMTVGTIIG